MAKYIFLFFLWMAGFAYGCGDSETPVNDDIPVSKAPTSIKLPHLISDNMVLQQNSKVILWGEATPKCTVTISASWIKQDIVVNVDGKGQWQASIMTPAGGPETQTLSFDDGASAPLIVRNILIGEVWICSGQSNMEMPLGGWEGCPVDNMEEAVTNADKHSDIRMLTVERNSATVSQNELEGDWLVASSGQVKRFSAVAYYFALELQEKLNVPVGLVVAAWGGSDIESWLPGGDKYNGMLYPCHKYAAKGFLWYQGESNVWKWYEYRKNMKELVKSWRSLWEGSLGTGENMPFYYAEIAPYALPEDNGATGIVSALLREVQYEVQKEIMPAGMVCTNDLVALSEENQIHPANKKGVGMRLAHLALSQTYEHGEIISTSPSFEGMCMEDGRVLLTFKNVGGGWMDIDKNSVLQNFELSDGKTLVDGCYVFYPASDISFGDGDVVTVSSDKVAVPKHIRYCFHNFMLGYMRNKAGLPLIPFRGESNIGGTYMVEAESGTSSGTSVALSDNPYASGERLLTNFYGDARLNLSLAVEEEGLYELSVYYMNEVDAAVRIQVNGGVQQNLNCPASGSWWNKLQFAGMAVTLLKGENTIVIIPGINGGPNLDKVNVVKMERK
ncbi:sialate O-acetylesterase [Bacteroides sp. 1001136B_160425_E2]|uniref:sialate O-acetylesterase n=1 Tax=Bacteroides sp. 1001136B_160425_E2 TaxID=2787083 RepID=UPI00189C8214|nr:sialate O-acetylesterase [Bacteroides sp. 1001136B_160425_E2]